MLFHGRSDVGFGMLISQRNTHDMQFSDAQRDMMAVSLPTGGPKSFNSNIEIANDLCIFRAEGYPQCISKENMDNIRKTMMKHEALFREQVQALHKLYSIQKSAMQEIRQRTDSHAQILTFNSNNIAVHDGQLCRAAGEGNHLRPPSCISTQDHSEGSLILSLHPICAIKEFTGYNPNTLSWMNSKTKNFPTAQTKPKLEIDLERPPEEYLEEFESKVEVKGYAMQGSNSNFLEGTRNTVAVEVSFMQSNLSVSHTDSPSLKWKDQDKDFRILPEPIQHMHQDCVQAPESKAHGIDMNQCSSGFYRLHESFQNTFHNFPCSDLPAVGKPSANEESILSSNHQAEKLACLHQGSLVVTAQRLNPIHNSISPDSREHLEISLARAKECIDLTYPPIYQPTESSNMVLTPDLKKEEEKLQKGSTGEESLSTHLIICPQASSMYKSVQYDLKDLNNLCILRSAPLETQSVKGKQNLCSSALTSETSEDDGGNNPNHLGHGNNSIQADVGNICNDGKISTLIIEGSPKLVGECGELIHMSNVKTEGGQSELKEVAQLSNNSTGTNFSSFIPASEANHMDEGNCSNGSPGTAASHGEPVVTGSNEVPKNKSTIEEACENVAAKILLSFASCTSWGDNSSDVHIKADTTRLNLDETKSDKQNLFEERVTNYDNGGIEKATVEWTISLHGRKRRKLRRPQ